MHSQQFLACCLPMPICVYGTVKCMACWQLFKDDYKHIDSFLLTQNSIANYSAKNHRLCTRVHEAALMLHMIFVHKWFQMMSHHPCSFDDKTQCILAHFTNQISANRGERQWHSIQANERTVVSHRCLDKLQHKCWLRQLELVYLHADKQKDTLHKYKTSDTAPWWGCCYAQWWLVCVGFAQQFVAMLGRAGGGSCDTPLSQLASKWR